jgi:hypothetical protein
MSQQSEYDAIEDYFLNIHVCEETGCYLWEGSCSPNGYGIVNFYGRTQSAHKNAWEEMHGEIPDGLIIRHKVCDRRNCLNTEHMVLGTKADNTADMMEKDRCCHNPRTGRKVEPEEAAAMAKMYSEGSTWYRIGITFGRSQQLVKQHVERYLGIGSAAA